MGNFDWSLHVIEDLGGNIYEVCGGCLSDSPPQDLFPISVQLKAMLDLEAYTQSSWGRGRHWSPPIRGQAQQGKNEPPHSNEHRDCPPSMVTPTAEQGGEGSEPKPSGNEKGGCGQ